jgi:RHS repeat-associated protein
MGQETGLDPQIELFDRDGVVVVTAWGEVAASITQALEKTGTYTVVVSDYGGTESGAYWLSLVKTVEFAAYISSPLRSGSILAGDTLRFSADSSKVAEAGNIQYQWDFGDGRSSSLKDPGLVTFPTAGEWVVTLSVVVNQTQFNPTTRTIAVAPDTGSVPDLAVTELNVPPNLSISQPTQISYTVQNIGNEPLSGKSWKDALYLSRDAYLDVNDLRLAFVPVSEDVPVGGTYTNTLIATIPAVAEGAYYLLLSVDDEWQVLERHQLNNEFAVATDLVIPRLADGVSTSGTFTASGQTRYYRIDVPSGQNLFVRLDDLDDQGANEIYVRFGSLPTRGTFDYRANVSGKADQQLLVPAATSGTWYVMVYGASVPGDGDFTLEATFSQLKVAGVVPNSNPSTTEAVLAISGAGFYGAMTVELVAGGGTAYPADTVEVDSFTQITARFAAGSLPPGFYSVRVSRGGDSDTLPHSFEVLSAGEAKLEADLIVPSRLGYHAPATIYVEYRNAGNASMPAPLLVLTATQNGREGAFLTLEALRLVDGFWTSAEPEGFSHSVQILAGGEMPGVLQPGESSRVPVYYAGWEQPWDFSYPPIQFNLGALTTDNAAPVDWDTLKDSMRPASINPEAWEAIWANFVAQVGNTWGDYLEMLDENASYVGRLGQRVVDVGQLLAFEFLQADGLSPLWSLASAVDDAVQAPGLFLVFTRFFPQPVSLRYELGPLGRGWAHNWQFSLHKASDGKVTITGPGGSRRVFQPDSRHPSSYFPQPGDHATLTALSGGAFGLREPSGLLRAFRSDGKLDYVEDPNGNRISASYAGSLLTGLTHSSGQWLKTVYNAAGRIQSLIDHLGRQTQFSYDAANEHLIGAQYYDGRTAAYAYGTGPSLHALTQVAPSCCTRRYLTYDAQGRLTDTHRDGNGEAVSFTYDTAGKVIAADSLGRASKFFFDHRGLLVKTENALGNAVHLVFDDEYNLECLTDPAGRSYSYRYDSCGNLVQITDPLGHANRFTFTSLFNRLASVTDANGNVTRYAYTANGNLESMTYADGSHESWAYDAIGNATTWTNRRGHAINYDYDTAGRMTEKTYADGSHADYIYDSRGNLISATDPIGTTGFTYDAYDHLVRIDYPGARWLRFSHDCAGRRASSEDQLGHLLTYHYDAAGRLESMTDESGAEVVHYSYDATGRLTRKTLGNGVYTTYEYDAAGQVLHLVNFNAGSSVLSQFDYTYDNRGRRTSMDTLDGKWIYEYDDLGQLTHAVFDSANPEIPDQDLTYLYDALGNRVRAIENGVTTEYTVNNMNQYVRVGDTDYVFDLDGNLVQEISPEGTATHTYNDGNRLIAVTKGADIWEYAYNALGNRAATTENGITTCYAIDPIGLGNVVAEYDGSGNLVAHYDHTLGLLSRIDAAGDPAYYTFDAVGNVQQLVTAAGSIPNTYAYTPFGSSLRKTETISNPFQFAGRFGVMKEGNGLNFMRARFYSSQLGRFLNMDPVGISGGDVNLYRYARNKPLRYVDPTGLQLVDADFEPPGEYEPFPGGGPSEPITYDQNHEAWEGPDLRDELMRNPDNSPVMEFPWSGWPLKPEPKPNVMTVPWEDYMAGVIVKPGTHVIPLLPRPPADSLTSAGSAVSIISDPNAKVGPSGSGTGGFVQANWVPAYRIDFENEPSATSPAQQVIITDQLSSNLDWATFQLTEIGFGDRLVVVPPNTQQYETSVSVSYLDTDFEVQVEAGIRLADGKVYAIFRSIDPTTGLPPTVDVGFLPPEDGTGRGRGHVSYTINPKAGLATGTEIRNVADISFDYQPAIATNLKDPHDPTQGTDPAKECLNTIDADPPTSSVAALPASTGTQFLVSWFGDDVGAGVASYDIYVSDNSGPWTLWLTGTTDICAKYDGEVGHTYAFYSIARDNVGHYETPPAQADAATTTTARLHIISVFYTAGAELTWSSSPGATYTVQSRTDLLSGAWNAEATVPSQGEVTTWTDPDTLSSRKFYRIGIE